MSKPTDTTTTNHLAVAYADPITGRVNLIISRQEADEPPEYVDGWDCANRQPSYYRVDEDELAAGELAPTIVAASLELDVALAIRAALDNALPTQGGGQ